MDKSVVKYLDKCEISIDNSTKYVEDYLIDEDGNLLIIGYTSTQHCIGLRFIGDNK
jgi:hypothetical protein